MSDQALILKTNELDPIGGEQWDPVALKQDKHISSIEVMNYSLDGVLREPPTQTHNHTHCL